MIDKIAQSLTTPPAMGTPAASLTDRQKLALCIAAGAPIESSCEGGMITFRTAVKCAVSDRGDGGYIVAIDDRDRRAP